MLKFLLKNYALSLPGNSNCQKNLSSANGEIYDAKKPAATAVVAVPNKNSNELSGKPTEALI
jgi:hypothetical protein